MGCLYLVQAKEEKETESVADSHTLPRPQKVWQRKPAETYDYQECVQALNDSCWPPTTGEGLSGSFPHPGRDVGLENCQKAGIKSEEPNQTKTATPDG